MTLGTPNAEHGHQRAHEAARKVVKAPSESGLDGVIRHVMIPGMIEEHDGRPIEMKPKLDVLDLWSLIKPELPGGRGLYTQATAFIDEPALRQRVVDLRASGIAGIALVGVLDYWSPPSPQPTGNYDSGIGSN